ncbi:MAG: hypothetical protein Q7R79_01170, partial [bacterium]|nr:hypothetical protein [bacterium]
TPLTKKGRLRLLTKIKLGQLVSAENRRERTNALLDTYRNEASKELRVTHIDRIMEKIICSLLYWCEGAKNPVGGVRFTNSDPKLIRTFLVLFRRSFTVDENRIRIGLHLHEYHDVKKQTAFWSGIAAVDKNKFIRPYLKPHTGKRIRKDYPGCAQVRYHDNNIARQLLITAEVFLQKMGV